LRQEFEEKFADESVVAEELMQQVIDESRKRAVLQIRLSENSKNGTGTGNVPPEAETLEQQLAEEIILREELEIKLEELSEQFAEISQKYEELVQSRVGDEREIARKALETLKQQLDANNLVIHEKGNYEQENERKITELKEKLEKAEKYIGILKLEEGNSKFSKILEENAELKQRLDVADGAVSRILDDKKKLEIKIFEKDEKIKSLVKEKEEIKKNSRENRGGNTSDKRRIARKFRKCGRGK